MKVCIRCFVEKDESEFYAHPRAKDGLSTYCKSCQKEISKKYHREHKEEVHKKRRKYDRARPRMHKNAQLKHNYKITLAEYEAMYESQNGKCAICLDELIHRPTPNVDHDHATGKVRGILCPNCNSGLANFKDSLASLHSAIEYLLRSRDG